MCKGDAKRGHYVGCPLLLTISGPKTSNKKSGGPTARMSMLTECMGNHLKSTAGQKQQVVTVYINNVAHKAIIDYAIGSELTLVCYSTWLNLGYPAKDAHCDLIPLGGIMSLRWGTRKDARIINTQLSVQFVWLPPWIIWDSRTKYCTRLSF